MSISIVIPNIARQESLRRCIQSLDQGVVVPDEIIIIEQSSRLESQQYTKDFFDVKNISNIQSHYQEEKCTAKARQKGLDLAQGNYICFLDNDISLDEKYLEIAQNYMEKNSTTLGITGAYQHHSQYSFGKIISSLFGMYSLQGRNKILSSGFCDYIRGSKLQQEQPIDFMYGCNMFIRKILKENNIRFNTNMTRWSYMEDVEFSHKINLYKPNSLIYLPNLSLTHHEEIEGKMLPSEVIRMMIIYRYIFWNKYIYQKKPTRYMSYLWGQCGFSLFLFLTQPKEFISALQTYRYLLVNHQAIINNKISYNKFILK